MTKTIFTRATSSPTFDDSSVDESIFATRQGIDNVEPRFSESFYRFVTPAPHFPGFRPRLYFIVGPTAVGKTALSIACAEALGAEILSCDSLCVYRGMDIGTAKPTRAERAAVPHHGIDLVPVSTPFSVDDYTRHAHGVIADCAARERHLLVVGGSGFYLKSFFAPVSDGIEVPAWLRHEVETLFAQEGLAGLRRELAPFDPGERARLDRRNPRRVMKALERCRATGRSLVGLQQAFAALPEPWAEYEKRVCLLRRPAPDLHARVRERIEAMFTEGLLAEVDALRAAGIAGNPSAAGAIGYRETLDYLRRSGHNRDLAELKETIAVHTDQLIRKQRIWFRRQIPVHTVVEAGSATVEAAFPQDSA